MQKHDNNNLDKLFRDELSHLEQNMSEVDIVWQRIDPSQKRRQKLFWLFYSGVLVLGAFIGGYFADLSTHNKKQASVENIYATTSQSKDIESDSKNLESNLKNFKESTSPQNNQRTNSPFQKNYDSNELSTEKNKTGNSKLKKRNEIDFSSKELLSKDQLDRSDQMAEAKTTKTLLRENSEPRNKNSQTRKTISFLTRIPPLICYLKSPTSFPAKINSQIDFKPRVKNAKHQNGRLYFSLGVAAFLPFDIVEDNTNSSELSTDLWSEYFSPLASYNSNLQLGYAINERLSIHCGLEFQHIEIQVEQTKEVKEATIGYNPEAFEKVRSSLFVGSNSYGQLSYQEIEMTRAYHRRLNIPIGLSYKFLVQQKSSFTIDPTLIIKAASSYRGKFVDENFTLIDVSEASVEKNTGLSGQLGFSYLYQVSPNLHFSLSCIGRYNLTNTLNEKAPVELRRLLIGGQLGFHYAL